MNYETELWESWQDIFSTLVTLVFICQFLEDWNLSNCLLQIDHVTYDVKRTGMNEVVDCNKIIE